MADKHTTRSGRGRARPYGTQPDRGGLCAQRSFRAPTPPDGRLGLCHREEVTHSIPISYSCRCNRFPSSYPSFTIRCPRALKTLCGRLEIVDRRDDHALIRRCGAPSPPPPLSPNDDRASASDAYAWPADRGRREPNRRAGRSCTSSGVRASTASGPAPGACPDSASAHPHSHLQTRHRAAGWSNFPPPLWSSFGPPLTPRTLQVLSISNVSPIGSTFT